jgi:N-formylglutamate deformylase
VLPPQIVLGDRFGTSAAPALVALMEQHFRRAGWRVARNAPYAGGHTTEFHAAAAAGIHAVQVEIDRSLYMDSNRMAPHAGFAEVAAQLTGLAQLLVSAAPALALGPTLREAAE